MKKRLTLILTLLVLASGLTITADDGKWPKGMWKAFVNAKEFNISFDFSKTSYCGLDSAAFEDYIKAIDPKFTSISTVKVLFSRACAEGFRKRVKGYSPGGKVYFPPKEGVKCNILVRVNEIGENGSIDSDVFFYIDNIENRREINIAIEQGRWNGYTVLLLENAEKLGKRISR